MLVTADASVLAAASTRICRCSQRARARSNGIGTSADPSVTWMSRMHFSLSDLYQQSWV